MLESLDSSGAHGGKGASGFIAQKNEKKGIFQSEQGNSLTEQGNRQPLKQPVVIGTTFSTSESSADLNYPIDGDDRSPERRDVQVKGGGAHLESATAASV